MRPFIKGLELSERFYREAVAPILARRFPQLVHSAALIGPGSDVLGLDTPQSMDHDWGPRLLLFLSEAEAAPRSGAIAEALRRELPPEIHGFPTSFGTHADGTGRMAAAEAGAVEHRVSVHTVRGYFWDVLGFDPVGVSVGDPAGTPVGNPAGTPAGNPMGGPAGNPAGTPAGMIRPVDWVSVPANRLLMLTAGRVFHDGLGELVPLRARLAAYPHDVWLYLLAAQWRRIGQEEAFVGRCGQVGDDLGSRLVAARLVRDLMHLCFLMARRYAPYLKWLATAFAQLDCGGELVPVFARVLAAVTWEERQTALTVAYEAVARMHNTLGVTEPLSTDVRPFWSRPFLVIGADRFVAALRAAITSEEVLALPERLGSVDQVVDSTDALGDLERLRVLYSASS